MPEDIDLGEDIIDDLVLKDQEAPKPLNKWVKWVTPSWIAVYTGFIVVSFVSGHYLILIWFTMQFSIYLYETKEIYKLLVKLLKRILKQISWTTFIGLMIMIFRKLNPFIKS